MIGTFLLNLEIAGGERKMAQAKAVITDHTVALLPQKSRLVDKIEMPLYFECIVNSYVLYSLVQEYQFK